MLKINTLFTKTLGDLYTPVDLYLKLRDKFPHSFLLESSDYKSKENSYSYLCLAPISSFVVTKDTVRISHNDNHTQELPTAQTDIVQALKDYTASFEVEKPEVLSFMMNGLFGYTAYDAMPLIHAIDLKENANDLPLIQYHFFKYLIVFNHFNSELYLIEHLQEHEKESSLAYLQSLVQSKPSTIFPFETLGEEQANCTDQAFLTKIAEAKTHCARGDVFQLVLSRKFTQSFKGDEFNVYRSLRAINPSPYLFYFDYGNFKIFGSSPEAQVIVREHQATLFPIAGTFKRTGNYTQDVALAEDLKQDPKESAEHIMLVDLARNDLSITSNHVVVEQFKQVEFYSHVIHLVSKVTAVLDAQTLGLATYFNTFPAGTLSGAPKHKAMQLIDALEPESRGCYGGAFGILGLDGTVNQAIFIRSLVSYQNTLTYQAGCGIVTQSDDAKELQEINNKLGAVRTAINLANTL